MNINKLNPTKGNLVYFIHGITSYEISVMDGIVCDAPPMVAWMLNMHIHAVISEMCRRKKLDATISRNPEKKEVNITFVSQKELDCTRKN